MIDVSPLFATPVAHLRSGLEDTMLRRLAQSAIQAAEQQNATSGGLRHSSLDAPHAESLRNDLRASLIPFVEAFGNVLMGEEKPWSIKEIWSNCLEPGASQAMHAHANSLCSGVLYLDEPDPSARLTFHRTPPGGPILANSHPGTATNIYNAERVQLGPTRAGDLVLFPSWVLHSVPVNRGARRLSIAFNAIPDSVETFGYRLGLSVV